ncbi:hypothetical protein [Kamptonema formosum]|uniref:hypothetical protein n=1 Tax=Kamptonema formosum TaxID=331992 RepID=UPI00034DBBAD|nr:hypothetical protein [Oscillatoria sp. PCC 10802]
MKDCLNSVAHRLPPDLVSRKALCELYTAAESLPPFSDAILECRLGAGASQVDLAVFLPNPSIKLPDTVPNHPVWGRFQKLFQEWADPNSDLHHSVNAMWLEFDVGDPPSTLPIPCVFLHLEEAAGCQAQSLLEMALKLLDSQVPPHLDSNLQLCAGTLPAAAKFTCIGAMLSRQSRNVRLIAKGISPVQLPVYLAEVGWAGSVKELEGIIPQLSIVVDNIDLSFDVGDTIPSRIGLECYVANAGPKEPRWQLFLDSLVSSGLCTPAKRNALLAWPGHDRQGFGLFFRLTAYIKIVCRQGSPLEAKAYLGLWH